MEKNELNVFSGDCIFKGGLEYFNDTLFLHGYPYYIINKVDGIYYLWELDRSHPDKRKYLLMKQNQDFIPLYEEAVKLERKLGEELRPVLWEPTVSE